MADTNETDTYGELLQRCVRTAIKMRSLGLTKDDVICLCSTNHRNTVDPYLAALFLGVKVASVSPQLTVQDIKYLVALVEPKIIFVDQLGAGVIEEVLKQSNFKTQVVAFHQSAEHTPFSEFLKPHPAEDTFEATTAENLLDTAVISFSSGTTGLPKGICLHQFMLMYRGLQMLAWLGITCRSGMSNYRHESNEDEAVVLSYSNLYWITAITALISTIFGGAARVICSEYRPKECWTIIDKYKVTMAYFSPSRLSELARTNKPNGIDTSSLKMIQVGGAPVSIKLFEDIKNMLPGISLAQAYGCTETACAITLFDLTRPDQRSLAEAKPSSSGYPLRGFWYKVVDVETLKALGPHQTGELLIKGQGIAHEYYRDGSTSPQNEDGWLATGDLVHYDNDYCFYIVDRLKQVLKVKSYQIPPSLIEQVVLGHPAVREVAVLGIPDPEYGDLPTAVVVLEDNSIGTKAEDIKKFVDDQVDDLKKLRGGVKFIEELPLTSTGKVKRLHLKELIVNKQL